MRHPLTVLRLCGAVWIGTGCQPALEGTPSAIREPMILAVQAEPAEVLPGDAVTLRALVAAPEGTLTTETLEWAQCNRARNVAENNSVAPECLDSMADWISPLGSYAAEGAVSAEVPEDACAVFGSEPPPAGPGEPPTRPADPDVTGGYYAPVRAVLSAGNAVTFGQVRVRCALPSAPAEIARAYAAGYTNNQNPILGAFLTEAGTPSFQRGAAVELTASWSADSAEEFVVYESGAPQLRDDVETLTVSWFASAGTFSAERTAATLDSTNANVTWTAPDSSEDVHLWAVLRDNRGGMSWLELRLDAE